MWLSCIRDLVVSGRLLDSHDLLYLGEWLYSRSTLHCIEHSLNLTAHVGKKRMHQLTLLETLGTVEVSVLCLTDSPVV